MKITLCGSARFEEYFKFWNEMLSLYDRAGIDIPMDKL